MNYCFPPTPFPQRRDGCERPWSRVIPSRSRMLFLITLLFSLFSLAVQAQQPVTGTVTSGDTAVAGATVSVKGGTTSTQTDANGHYSINAPLRSRLVISSVGFATRELEVRTAGSIDVSLERTTDQLNDIVVVGYGTQRKSDVTGSVSSVRLADIQKTPSPRVDDALQGRSAGVAIQHTDASPNANVVIRIRGINSINGGNDPLVVIDGLQGGNLNTLNPDDVQSIEILKDASATAIYGSRGANGVVLVTTKKGRSGRYNIGYDGFYSATSVRKKIDLMNAEQYATTVNANRTAFGQALPFSDSALNAFKTGGGTDWQDAIFQKGYSLSHTLNISGGNDRTNYYIAGNLLNTKGIILNSSYTRYSLRANVNTKLSDRLNVGINTFLGHEINHPTALNGFSNGSPIFSALLFAPTKSIYDADGNYTYPGGGYGPPTNYNPVALAREPVKDFLTNTTNVIANADYLLIPGLHINISGGYRLQNITDNDYENSKPTGQAGTELATIYDSTVMTLQNTNLVSYEKDIARDHHIKITALMEQQYEQSNHNSSGSLGFLTDALAYNNLQLGNSPQIPTSGETKRSLLSYMGRVNYGYKDLYLLTLTGRADGSSVFGANNKWGYFPSAAVGWNVGNERFMHGLTAITGLKVRASYGIVGNQAIQAYQSLASLNTGLPYAINGTSLHTGVGQGGLPNPDLKWEKTAQFDVGLDLVMLQNRLNFTADFYNKKTTDLLLAVPTPIVQGGNGSILENVGSVQNRGVEFQLGGKPVAGAFVWETNLSLSLNRNKVLALTNGQKEITLGSPGLPNFGNTLFMEVGKPLGEFRALIFDGVWKSGETQAATAFGTIPGAPKYRDTNGDGKINNDDKVDVGNAQPKFVYGWSNTFSFANFDLNIFIQGSQGNDIYNISRVRFETTSGDADATSVKILDRWSPTNDNTNVPSFEGSKQSEDLQSTRWLEDGSYVRLKNVSLGYTFPVKHLANAKINSLRFYVSGTNLLTLTHYSGFDPEAATGVDAFAGVDLATYPSQKAVTFGLNINF